MISVVIPSYNEEKYIGRCLEAIVNQKFPKENYEIVVVDNNSTDNTVKIAKSYGARIVVEKRQGNTFSLNCGLNSAKGEVIAATDADTVTFPNWLTNISKTFEDENVVSATGPAYVKTNNKLKDFMYGVLYEYFLRLNFLIGKPHIVGFNMAVRKKAFDEIGGLDEKFTMSPDIDLGLRMSKKGKVVFAKDMKVLTSFRRWQENLFGTFLMYFESYWYSVWLRLPPPVRQKAVR